MVFKRLKFAIEGRSPKWDGVRKAFIKVNPKCIACDSREKLEVHHIVPFNVNHSLELEPSNLMTLCRNCHLVLGHLKDFDLNNTQVRWLIDRFVLLRRSAKKLF